MFRKETLPNGTTLVFETLPHVRSAAVGIWVRAGAVDETADIAGENAGASRQPGISHFIEHMLFKGTQRRSAKEIAEAIDRTGGSMNAFTGKEATCYYVKSLSSHVGESADVLVDMLTGALFDADEMEKEKQVVYEEMKMIEDTPEDLGQDLVEEAVFDGSNLGHRIIGTKQTVGSITRDDILRYMSRCYTADNIVVAVCGNFDEQALTAQLSEGLAPLAPTRSLNRSVPHVAHAPSFLSRTKDIEQSHLYFGMRGVPYEHEDHYALTVYSSILGGGMSSRLFQKVREEKGLAYSVYSMSSAFVEDGIFLIYAGVGEGNERVTADAIREETELLAREGVGEAELAKAREQNKGHYIFNQENVSGRMFSAGRNYLLHGRGYTAEEIIGGIDAVTCEDIKRVAARYADLADYTSVHIGKKQLSARDMGL